MTGAHIAGALLRAAAPLIAEVPEANIKLGRLPDDVGLPALLIRVVSSVERKPLKRGGRVRTVDRVSVAGRFESYRQQSLIMPLVLKALAGRTGNLGGAVRVAITTAGGGPDLNGPGNSFERTIDFLVSFDAEA